MAPRDTQSEWRFLNTGFGNAIFNMALDEVLARGVCDGKPCLRVFRWKPPAVSFGYAQQISRDIDPDACARAGVDIVRRPTGGRAVLHWNELTYAVACREDDPLLGGTIQDVYRSISQCLVAGVRSLGVDARFEPGHTPVPSPRGRDLVSPCFSSTSQYEVTLGGRKLIGSAQRRFGGAILQHGSLLIGPEHKRIIDLLPPGHPRLRAAFDAQLDAHTVSLHEAGHTLAFDDVAEGLRRGFAQTLGVELLEVPLTTDERDSVQALVDEKYGDESWTFGDRQRPSGQPT